MFKKQSLVKTGLIAAVFMAFIGGAIILTKLLNKNDELTLIMGTMSGWPPYVTINEKGEYEGFDIDVAREIARRLNKKLSIKDMDLASIACCIAARLS